MKRKAEKDPNATNGSVSRRDFLKGAGAAVSTGILAVEGVAAPPQESGAEVLGPGKVPVTLRINGKLHKLSVEPRTTLLDALRNDLDVTGSKRVCDRGTCGACTMIVDGKAIYSCSTLAIEAEGHSIRTIEGLAQAGQLSPVMAAFVNNDAQQCGFCTPGFVMAATAFLEKYHNPTVEQVNRGLGGNICRCGTYHGLRLAVMEASKKMRA